MCVRNYLIVILMVQSVVSLGTGYPWYYTSPRYYTGGSPSGTYPWYYNPTSSTKYRFGTTSGISRSTWYWPTRPPYPYYTQTTPNPFVKEVCSNVYSCASCTSVRICSRKPYSTELVEYKVVNCASYAPYCNPSTGTCMEKPSEECKKKVKEEFPCFRDGIFPVPNNCFKYYICKNYVSYTYSCSEYDPYPTPVYDSVSETCNPNNTCHSFNCDGKNGYKVPYSNDPSVYSYCIKGIPAFTDRCQGKDELNITSQKCEPVCKYEGLIPDAVDITKYYRCHYLPLSRQLKMTHESCPPGQIYSADEFRCNYNYYPHSTPLPLSSTRFYW